MVSRPAARSFLTIGHVLTTDYVVPGNYVSQGHADAVAHASAWLRMLATFLDNQTVGRSDQ